MMNPLRIFLRSLKAITPQIWFFGICTWVLAGCAFYIDWRAGLFMFAATICSGINVKLSKERVDELTPEERAEIWHGK